mgnify:CR=1 FL=1
MAVQLKETLLGGGTKTLRSPRLRIKGDSLADLNVGMNYFLVGKPGSGKSDAVARLILSGLKVFMLSTDSGGDNGINTVKAQVLAAGKTLEYLMEHFRWAHVDIGDAVGEGRNALLEYLKFLRDPANFGDFTPTVLVWEGFANYQANYIVDEFDDMEGGVDNFKQWGKISTATVRDLEYFFKVPVLYKIVTCQEGQKSTKVKVGVDAKGQPIMEDRRVDTGGAALKTGALRSVLAAFDVVIRLGVDNGKYMYYIKNVGDNEGKKRVKLPEEMPADFMKVWDETKKQLGI